MQQGAPLKVVAGLLGAIGATVYLSVQQKQTKTVLVATTARLHVRGSAPASQKALNQDPQTVNHQLLSQRENLTAAKTTLKVSLAGS